MADLDDIDMEILRLLAADARRPYSDIADAVDRAPPTVSERIDRLQSLGVIRRFTVDVDRSLLRQGVQVLVTVDAEPGAAGEVYDDLAAAGAVESAFRTAEGRAVAHATVPDGDVEALLADATDLDAIEGYDVTLLTDVEYSPEPGGVGFALECAECGNTVTAEGETVRLGDSRYAFCCGSCRERFETRYADLEEGA